MMKRQLFVALLLSATLSSAFAMRSAPDLAPGGSAYMSNGETAQRMGDTTYYSNGTTATQMGNTTFYSDGSSSMRMGDTTFHSDGSSTMRMGNTDFHSDGTTSTRIGNTVFHSDGSSTMLMPQARCSCLKSIFERQINARGRKEEKFLIQAARSFSFLLFLEKETFKIEVVCDILKSSQKNIPPLSLFSALYHAA